MKIFEENQTSLHRGKTNCRVTVKHETISGQFQETFLTVITSNQESYFTCQEKSHSQVPSRYIDVARTTSTTLDVMLERSLTIMGISKGTEIDQMRGRVSHASPCWMTNFQKGIHGPGGG